MSNPMNPYKRISLFCFLGLNPPVSRECDTGNPEFSQERSKV